MIVNLPDKAEKLPPTPGVFAHHRLWTPRFPTIRLLPSYRKSRKEIVWSHILGTEAKPWTSGRLGEYFSFPYRQALSIPNSLHWAYKRVFFHELSSRKKKSGSRDDLWSFLSNFFLNKAVFNWNRGISTFQSTFLQPRPKVQDQTDNLQNNAEDYRKKSFWLRNMEGYLGGLQWQGPRCQRNVVKNSHYNPPLKKFQIFNPSTVRKWWNSAHSKHR